MSIKIYEYKCTETLHLTFEYDGDLYLNNETTLQ